MTHPRKPGWTCTREPEHDGPCALVPSRWTRLVHWLTGTWR